MDTVEQIKNEITSNKVVLFMKGTPDFPQCGFSMQVARALQQCNVPFSHVDVIAEPEVRKNLPQVSNWPTFPQLFVDGELVGGCDIIMDMHAKGELQNMLQGENASA